MDLGKVIKEYDSPLEQPLVLPKERESVPEREKVGIPA